MQIQKRWTKFTEANIKKLPNERGAYELASNNKRIIYQGGSDSGISGVRGRLIDHLIHNKYPIAKFFRCEVISFFGSGISVGLIITLTIAASMLLSQSQLQAMPPDVEEQNQVTEEQVSPQNRATATIIITWTTMVKDGNH